MPSDSYDVLFLKARIVIMCSKGFEVMDLSGWAANSCGIVIRLLTLAQLQECYYPSEGRPPTREVCKEGRVMQTHRYGHVRERRVLALL